MLQGYLVARPRTGQEAFESSFAVVARSKAEASRGRSRGVADPRLESAPRRARPVLWRAPACPRPLPQGDRPRHPSRRRLLLRARRRLPRAGFSPVRLLALRHLPARAPRVGTWDRSPSCARPRLWRPKRRPGPGPRGLQRQPRLRGRHPHEGLPLRRPLARDRAFEPPRGAGALRGEGPEPAHAPAWQPAHSRDDSRGHGRALAGAEPSPTSTSTTSSLSTTAMASGSATA